MYIGADAETAEDVAARDYDTYYATGRAIELLDCQEERCAASCP
jgi:hypothetical protein